MALTNKHKTGQKTIPHPPNVQTGYQPVNLLFYCFYSIVCVFTASLLSLCLLSGVWLVVVDCVLDRSLLHIPRAAAGDQPAAHLLCHPAGSGYDHGEDMSFQKLIRRLSSLSVFLRGCVVMLFNLLISIALSALCQMSFVQKPCLWLPCSKRLYCTPDQRLYKYRYFALFLLHRKETFLLLILFSSWMF